MTIRASKGQRGNDAELIALIQRALNGLRERQIIRNTNKYLGEAYIAIRLYLDQNERDTSDPIVRGRLVRIVINRVKAIVDIERKNRFKKLPKTELPSPQPEYLQNEVAEFFQKAMNLYVELSKKRPYKGAPSRYYVSGEKTKEITETRNHDAFFQWLDGQVFIWKKMGISQTSFRIVICKERMYWCGYASYYLPASVEVQRIIFGSEDKFWDFPHIEEVGIETLRVMLGNRWPKKIAVPPTSRTLKKALEKKLLPPLPPRYTFPVDIAMVRWTKKTVLRWLANHKKLS